ncbi:hypothetical protein [Marinicrinis lubricantis]|uniref:Uncharacterized protein n=1 Tax=Marinicrinis lubricantis TaxID=2086470 RepID=A0ABW1IJX3_9BACL
MSMTQSQSSEELSILAEYKCIPHRPNDLNISDMKRQFFKTFLIRLGEDPAMSEKNKKPVRPLAEWIMKTGYSMEQCFEFDQQSGELLPQQRPQIDMAKLLNLCFKQHNMDCTADDLMLHIIQGGTLQSFLDRVD